MSDLREFQAALKEQSDGKLEHMLCMLAERAVSNEDRSRLRALQEELMLRVAA